MGTIPKNFRCKKQYEENYSLISFKKEGLLPLLAYETGLHLGDGSMGHYYSKFDKQRKYGLQYTGDAVNEYEYYTDVIQPLLKKLYGLQKTTSFSKKDNSCFIFTRVKSICIFKKEIGLPLGRKINVTVPPLINTKKLKKYFLRGFADTDFSLSFRKRKRVSDYPVISCKLADKILVKQLYTFCRDLGLKPTTTFNLISKSERYKKEYAIVHELALNGRNNLDIWMKKIGFWSPKHYTKFIIWDKTGIGPTKTTIKERYKILKRLDIKIPITPPWLSGRVPPW